MIAICHSGTSNAEEVISRMLWVNRVFGGMFAIGIRLALGAPRWLPSADRFDCCNDPYRTCDIRKSCGNFPVRMNT